MQTILDKILETKRKELEELYSVTTLAELAAQAADAPPAKDFYAALTKKSHRPVNLIAEIKKASPSKGLIREDFDPPTLARAYQAAGADAISVLTDEQYFQGHLDFLREVRKVVDLPLIRKDFIIDPAQIYQARIAGADAILLIAAALEPEKLLELLHLAGELGMTVLLEVHNEQELADMQALAGYPWTGRALIGVNNRDLKTFNVDLQTTLRLRKLVADDVPVVGESGIATRQDVDVLAEGGVAAILVGETFMRQGDVAQAIEDMLGPVAGE